jgi:hypothetical protein
VSGVGKLVVVKGDPVSGTDKHNVAGQATNPGPPPPTVPYTGIADFAYNGAMTDALSDWVSIGGVPVALVSSHSSLNAGEAAPPAGKHSGPQGGNFVPPAPTPVAVSLSITDSPLGTGVPNAGAGSALLTVGGVRVLLDADKIDTCSGVGAPAGSTVAANGQSFVTTD